MKKLVLLGASVLLVLGSYALVSNCCSDKCAESKCTVENCNKCDKCKNECKCDSDCTTKCTK